MSYSNGYNLTTVLAELAGRLAWRTDSTLSEPLKTSKSGRYFDDGSFHAVVNVPNIKDVVPSQTDWNAYFTNKEKSVIARSLQKVFTQPEFKEQVFAFTAYDEVVETEETYGRAVGLKINIANVFDVAVQIKKLVMYFNQAKTFNVYLFKHGNKTVVKTKSVTTVANERVTVDLTDWFIDYKTAEAWYIVYFEADLDGAKPIKESTCRNASSYFGVTPFYTSTTGSDFNRRDLNYPSEPFGINAFISSFRDFSDNIIQQGYLFDELVGLTMAYVVIEDILYSTNSNKRERILKEQATELGLSLDLKGAAPISESPRIKGLLQRIDAEAERVRKSFYPTKRSQIVHVNY